MPDQSLPVYKVVDGVLVRKDGDVRDPTRRYSHVAGAEGTYLREFTDEEERQRNEEEARWAAEAPQRELEAKRREAEAEAFRASLKYETRFVAFVDILGWTSAVRRSPADPTRTQSLGLALNIIRNQNKMAQWMLEQGGADGWPGDPRMTHFSDCLAISTKADFLGKHHLISALGFLSNSLLYQGFILRGGITAGDVYHRESMLFGPAFLKAYELESHCAIYPRVILDPALARAWGQGDVYPDKDGSEIGRARTWRLSHDGFRFFDFLQPFGGLPFFAKSPSLIQHSLQPLRALLVERLRAYRENLSVLAKYVWLTNYFNDVCREYSGHEVDPIAIHEQSV